jgi:acyl-CoA thioesterase YciA
MSREPAIKVIAMPKDANPDGDIFGGWIISMMDLAGAIIARGVAKTRIVTVAVNNMTFHLPVYIGDCVECYGEVLHIGNSSIRVKVETWVERRNDRSRAKVTEGEFVFVAIGADRKPVVINKNPT